MTRQAKPDCEWPGCSAKATRKDAFMTGKIGLCGRHSGALAWWVRRFLSPGPASVELANRMADDMARGVPRPFTLLCARLGEELSQAERQRAIAAVDRLPNGEAVAGAFGIVIPPQPARPPRRRRRR